MTQNLLNPDGSSVVVDHYKKTDSILPEEIALVILSQHSVATSNGLSGFQIG